MKKLELIITSAAIITLGIICYQLNGIKKQVEEQKNEQTRTEIIKQTSHELRDSHKIKIITDSANVKGLN